jgi:mono/diheme cytochrome c family protein
VYPKGKGLSMASLDDPIPKRIKIGVHLLGDDYTNPPPVHELGKRGVVDNVVGFSTFYSAQNPPSAIIDAVAAGTIDVALVWGPIAGYYAKRQAVPLALVPIPSRKGDLPFAFDISMGVKRGNDALHAQLERVLASRQADILGILEDYGVPVMGKAAAGATPAAQAPAPARASAAPDVYKSVYDGWKWWHVYCYRCHGVNAVATTMAPDLIDPNRKLARAAFLKVVRNGAPDKGMQAWDKLLDEKQIADLFVYVRARADKVLPPGRPDEVGPNGGAWVPPAGWTGR